MASFLFRLVRVVIVLGVSLGLAFTLYQARHRPEKQKVVRTPPGVRVMPVHSGTQTMTVEAFGTVFPRKKVNIAVEVGGRIDFLNPDFREGAAISAGDLLIRIDQRSFVLDERAARVGVGRAKADINRLAREIENYKTDVALAEKNLALTRKEWDRAKKLEENQFASKNTVEKAEQQFLAAKIQLQSAHNRLALTPPMMEQLKAALALARNNLDKARLVLEKSEIKSGFDGYILTKKAEIGEFVNPGQVLGILYEKGDLDVDVRIPLEELAWIRQLIEQGRRPKAEVVIANLDGGRVWPAHVARIKANMDEKTRTLPITIEIDQEAGQDEVSGIMAALKPGTFVRCRIMGEIHDNIFVLPRYLLQKDDRIYLARENKLEIRTVTVLRRYEDKAYISAGLSDGDLVVSSPLPGAEDGMDLVVKSKGDAQ